jgi:hypothetical protein
MRPPRLRHPVVEALLDVGSSTITKQFCRSPEACIFAIVVSISVVFCGAVPLAFSSSAALRASAGIALLARNNNVGVRPAGGACKSRPCRTCALFRGGKPGQFQHRGLSTAIFHEVGFQCSRRCLHFASCGGDPLERQCFTRLQFFHPHRPMLLKDVSKSGRFTAPATNRHITLSRPTQVERSGTLARRLVISPSAFPHPHRTLQVGPSRPAGSLQQSQRAGHTSLPSWYQAAEFCRQ